TALVWRADGSDVAVPVAELVTGNMTTSLAQDDVDPPPLRSPPEPDDRSACQRIDLGDRSPLCET
ncbi:hypothetical protein C5D04_09090, partial [Rathayibacter sp. AY1D2]|uniref:hypothetical protein n=1 Tax=Rathayibacter sp. AY1D2 TaxID=2080543 RepID=UPI000D4323B8